MKVALVWSKEGKLCLSFPLQHDPGQGRGDGGMR